MTANKQLERTVKRQRGRAASAPFHYAHAARWTAQHAASTAALGDTRAMTTNTSAAEVYCSFCGLSSKEVAHLVAGPRVFICDKCAQLCADIMQKEKLGANGQEIPATEVELSSNALRAALTNYPEDAVFAVRLIRGARK